MLIGAGIGIPFQQNVLARLLGSAEFFAPLTHSAIPTRAASGTTGTFTRATTSTWPNNDGYLVTGVAGEIGFVGARRIYNKLTNTGWSDAASGTYGTVPTGWTADVGTGTLTVASSATYTGHNQITFTATAQRPFIRLAVAVAAYSVNILSVRVVENASGEPINDIITGSSVPAGSTETYSVNGSTVAASYVPVAGDVIEYKIATAATAGTPNWRVGLGCQGAATGSVTLVSPQLEDVTAQTTQTAGEYVSVGVESAPYYHGSFVDGVKCFPTDISGNPIPSTTLLGYSAEGARTNLCLQSNAFTTTWLTGGTPSATQNVVGPDGATSAWTVTDDSVAATEFYYQSITLTAAAYTFSVFVKKTTGAQASYPVLWAVAGTVSAHCTIDTSNGTATIWTAYTGDTMLAGQSARVTSFNDDFWRVEMTYTGTAAAYLHVLVPAGTTNPTQSTGVLDVAAQGSAVFYGAQVELGSFASSYIATTTVAVTRNADVEAVSTSGNIAAAAGSVYLEYTPTHSPSGTIAFWGTYVDASNYTAILHDATNLIFRKRIAGVNYDATIANAFVSGTTYKVCATWGTVGTSITLNGTEGTPHANTTAAQIAATMQWGADGNSLQQPFASIRNCRDWLRQLSASERAAVTA